VEAMNVLIKNSARDMIEVVRSTLQVVLSQLEQSFSAPVLTAEDRDRLQGLQSLLCGNLQARISYMCRTNVQTVRPLAWKDVCVCCFGTVSDARTG